MYLQKLNVKQVWYKKGLADLYETILYAWEFIAHTWYTRIADENENHIYRANRYDTILTS